MSHQSPFGTGREPIKPVEIKQVVDYRPRPVSLFNPNTKSMVRAVQTSYENQQRISTAIEALADNVRRIGDTLDQVIESLDDLRERIEHREMTSGD